jgi:NAD(P)-dependent dehydrogenase (short-subunit alcohol dehydrogenase family)
MQLAGKRIVVTGGANGIAAATVRAYAREGARVVSMDVEDDLGRRVAAEAGGDARYRHCDVSRRDEVMAAFEAAVGDLGGLDVLAHVAAVEGPRPAEDLEEADLERMFRVNVYGTVYTNQAAFRHMKAAGGRIINFGSGAGIRGQKGSAHYSASKGAVMSWTRTVAQEWAPYGITVNSVVPAIWTRMYDSYRRHLAPDALAIHDMAMQHAVPLGGRLGDPDRDMAPVMVFLASDAPRFVTGQIFPVDGGMVMLS